MQTINKDNPHIHTALQRGAILYQDFWVKLGYIQLTDVLKEVLSFPTTNEYAIILLNAMGIEILNNVSFTIWDEHQHITLFGIHRTRLYAKACSNYYQRIENKFSPATFKALDMLDGLRPHMKELADEFTYRRWRKEFDKVSKLSASLEDIILLQFNLIR